MTNNDHCTPERDARLVVSTPHPDRLEDRSRVSDGLSRAPRLALSVPAEGAEGAEGAWVDQVVVLRSPVLALVRDLPQVIGERLGVEKAARGSSSDLTLFGVSDGGPKAEAVVELKSMEVEA
jgi:hypothetical protein